MLQQTPGSGLAADRGPSSRSLGFFQGGSKNPKEKK